jgi:peptidoglycan/LPS O-acetylase OafA/YrhL
MPIDVLENVGNDTVRQSMNATVGLAKASLARIPELDGLRGLAIVSVMLYHYMDDAGRTSFGLAYKFRQLFRLGWSGVDLFFVLSGFLIGGILLDARKSNSYFRTFYARRAFRILPMYFLWIALYVVAVGVMLRWPLHALPVFPATLKLIPLYLIFAQSLVTAFPRVSLAWYWFSPTWSLAVEEQFYLIAAPVVRFLSSRGLLVSLLTTIILSQLIRVIVHMYWSPGIFSSLSFCRADSLAVGILIAMAWKNRPVREWISGHKRHVYAALWIASIPMAVFLKWSPGPDTLFAAAFELQWVALFYAILLVAVLAHPSGTIAGIFRWGFLREMGRVSYCAYLIHFSVSALLHSIILRQQPTLDSVAGVALAAGAFLVTIGLAELSAKYFEGPMLRYGHRFRY